MDPLRAATWTCRVTGPDSRLPDGADLPMRQAVRAAYLRVTGNEATELSSGWGEITPEPSATADAACERSVAGLLCNTHGDALWPSLSRRCNGWQARAALAAEPPALDDNPMDEYPFVAGVPFDWKTHEPSATVDAAWEAFIVDTEPDGWPQAQRRLRGGVRKHRPAIEAALAAQPEPLDVCLRCGVTRKQLTEMCKEHLMFPPAEPPALDVERLADDLERAMREHILGKSGWPHIRGGPLLGDGLERIYGCSDLCASDIAAEYARLAATTDTEGGD